ncbi:MAG TPA: hypothetical protein VMT27_09890 [Actinomycetes bacterium]|nr:hypothetical protein [Actinomycetes bacterium]
MTTVLAARADRAAMVRDYLASVTDEVLDEELRNPHNPRERRDSAPLPARDPRRGWELLRFALRDLDVIAHP